MRAVLEDQRADLVINSITSLRVQNGVNLFPNPTTGMVNLEFENLQNELEISIVNLQGEVISSRKLSKTNKVTIQIPGSAGVYFVTIVSGKSVQTYKVLKL